MPRVLVVDDDPLVLNLLVEEFRPGVDVIPASSYDEAIRCLDAGDPIDAVVADWRLGPGPDGLDLLREVRQRIPHAPRLLVSGHVGDFLTKVVLATGAAHACVSKPWDFGSLRHQTELLLGMPAELLAATDLPPLPSCDQLDTLDF